MVTEYISFCGSIVLAIAGAMTKWRPRAGATATAIASAAVWSFYGPAVVHDVLRIPDSMTTFNLAFVIILPVTLLVGTTFRTLYVLLHSESPPM